MATETAAEPAAEPSPATSAAPAPAVAMQARELLARGAIEGDPTRLIRVLSDARRLVAILGEGRGRV